MYKMKRHGLTLVPLVTLMVMVALLLPASGVRAAPSDALIVKESAAQPAPTEATQFTDLPIALQMVASENMGQNDAAYHLTDTYRFNNPAHGISTAFGGDGVTFAQGTDATWTLSYAGVGYGDVLATAAAPTDLRVSDNRVEYVHGDVTEWYVNGPVGVQQGVTLDAPPAGPRGELTVAFDMAGTLTAEMQGDSIRLVRADGSTAFTYSGLIAFDATGRDLPARMAVTDGRLTLHADDTGAVYPVTIDPFVQQAYLKASNTDANDQFGYSVAVDGDTVVVGARYEDSNATGVNGDKADNSANNSGAAYVFVRTGTTWAQQAYLKASNTGAGDLFGISVAVSGDTIVVGAYGEDSNAIGVNGNGTDNSASGSGAAYVFVRTGTTWTQQAYLKASNTDASDFFGISVALDGDTVVIGAIEEDSNAMGVNGNEADNSVIQSGAAYVFVRLGTTWSQQAYLKASNTDGFDRFGTSVAVDGDTVVVGVHNEDSSATGVNGNGTDNSVFNSGAAYIFVRTGTTWSQQAYLKASNTGVGDGFGWSVAVDGDTVVVGANGEDSNATGVNGPDNNSAFGSGAAYVFVRAGTSWAQQAYLKASNTGAGDFFGYSVGIDGNTVVVGANGEDSNATGVDGPDNNLAGDSGAAYVFVRSGMTWNQQAYLKASSTGPSDQFGRSVGIDGNTVVAGAITEDSNAIGVNGDESDNSAANSGAVYVFGPAPPSFTSVPAPDGILNEAYSHTFTADGDTPITFSTNDALPDGLTLSGDTLSGTPTTVGTFTGTITATNDVGTDTQAFEIFIATPPSFTSAVPPDGVVGTVYSHTFTADGDAPITFSTSDALPDGLTLVGDTLSGTPTVGGTFSGTITATNDAGTDTQSFSIFIATPPSITSSPAPDGVVGTAYSHTFTADGDAPTTFSTSDPLPDGLTLVGDTLSGTPTVGGTFSGTITATNDAGTDTQAFSIFIATPPTITSDVLGDGTVGEVYSHTFTATGDTPITFSMSSGALPDGLTLSGDTISGTPTTADTFTGEVTATNTAGTDTQAFSITIAPAPVAPTITSDAPGDGTVGEVYSHTFTATGDTPITFSMSSGALPDGLTLSGDTISGTPTIPGTFTGEVTATNNGGTDTQAFSITIAPAPVAPTITSDAPGDGTVGEVYSHTFTATGDTPITYSVSSGALPDGLTLSGDTISGTPTVADTFTGEVTATNSAGSDTQAFSITVAEAPVTGEPPVRLYPADGQTVTAANSGDWQRFQFQHVDGAEWYGLWIGNDTTTGIYQWFPATATSSGITSETPICDTSTMVCTLPADVWLADGDYSWWMTYWGPTLPDWGSYWNETTFSVDYAAPSAGALTGVTPSGTVDTAPTEVTWDRDPNVLWMEIWVGQVVGPDGDPYTAFYGWVDATEICDATTCTLTLDSSALPIPDGEYQMWMRLWGPGGFLQWTDVNGTSPAAAFTVETGS